MPLTIPEPQKIRADFFTTIGDGIKVAVQGEYDPSDADTGMLSEYLIHRVWVETDLDATNLYSLVDGYTLARIRAEGRKHFEQKPFTQGKWNNIPWVALKHEQKGE